MLTSSHSTSWREPQVSLLKFPILLLKIALEGNHKSRCWSFPSFFSALLLISPLDARRTFRCSSFPSSAHWCQLHVALPKFDHPQASRLPASTSSYLPDVWSSSFNSLLMWNVCLVAKTSILKLSSGSPSPSSFSPTEIACSSYIGLSQSHVGKKNTFLLLVRGLIKAGRHIDSVTRPLIQILRFSDLT